MLCILRNGVVYGLHHFFAISAMRCSCDGSTDEARVLTGVYMKVLTDTLTGVYVKVTINR